MTFFDMYVRLWAAGRPGREVHLLADLAFCHGSAFDAQVPAEAAAAFDAVVRDHNHRVLVEWDAQVRMDIGKR